MRKAPVHSRGSAPGSSSAPAAHVARPASVTSLVPGFAFLTSEGRQRYRIDEVIREIGRRGWLSARVAPYAWGFGGFLIGAIFWHAVGFWGILGSVVLKPQEAGVSVITRPAEAVAGVANCTLLVLDRSTGRTTSVPCPEPMPAFDEARGARQDFAAVRTR